MLQILFIFLIVFLPVNLSGNDLGRLSLKASGDVETERHYRCDALDRLETLVEGVRTTTYQYDGNSNVRLRSLPNGDAVETGYDALNRPILVEATAGGGAPLYTYEQGYDLTGNLHKIEETRIGAIGSRLVVNDYDEANRLWKETVTPVSGPVVTTTYSLDRANNRTEKMVQDGSGTTSTIYGVNDLNQLTGLTEGNRTVSFAYDKAGNRKSQTAGGSTDTYTYDYDNRLVQLAKQVPGPGITTGTYRYIYDYRSRRVERWEDGNRTQSIFSGGASVMERTVRLVTDALSDPDGDGYENLLEYAFGLDPLGWGSFSCGCSGYDNWAEIAITQRISPALKESYETPRLNVEFVRGSDIGGGVGGILYSIRGSTANYSHHNSRGDIVARTNDAGSLTYQATYEAFGTRTQESGSNLDRQRANSKDEDPTGLLNEGFRYRDLETGVFLTRDPAGFVDGPNLYTYVLQNPWSKFDPEGLSWKAVFYGEFWSQVGNELASNTRATLIDPIINSGQRAADHAGKAADAYYEGNTGGVVKDTAATLGITAWTVAENAPGGRSVRGVTKTADAVSNVNRARRGGNSAADASRASRRADSTPGGQTARQVSEETATGNSSRALKGGGQIPRNRAEFEIEPMQNHGMQTRDGRILEGGTVKSRTDYVDGVPQRRVDLDHSHGNLDRGHVNDIHVNPNNPSQINTSKPRAPEPGEYLSPVLSDPRTQGGVFRP